MATALVQGAAVAAGVGGVSWMVKGGAILAGFGQPPVTLELGLACFGAALLLLAASAGARVATALGLVATLGGAVSMVTEVVGVEVDPVIALASLALLVGLLLLAPDSQPGGWFPRGIGVATIPVVGVGGLLALVDEALLEMSTVVLGLAWAWLAVRLWRPGRAASLRRRARPASP